jgi:cyclic pyranopterin phosphate synthase
MSNSPGLSHLDQRDQAHMVDVGAKQISSREAVAEALVVFPPAAFDLVKSGDLPKGGIVEPARIAAIQAAKRTSELIPMCHQLPLDSVEIDVVTDSRQSTIRITCTARATARTGVEMEAMVAASTAALVIYDMTKALSKGIVIERTRLLRKSGGKSGLWEAQ